MLNPFQAQTSLDRQAQEDLNQLLEIMPILALDRLEQGRGFLPFATVISADGLLEPFGFDLLESSSPGEVLEQLGTKMQLEMDTGNLAAYGICSNVITHPKDSDARTHALCLMLSCSSDFVAKYYIPYELIRDQAPQLREGYFRPLEYRSAS